MKKTFEQQALYLKKFGNELPCLLMGHKIDKKSTIAKEKGLAFTRTISKQKGEELIPISEESEKVGDSFLEILKMETITSINSSKKNPLSHYLQDFDEISKVFLMDQSAENLKKFRKILQEILNVILKEGMSVKKFQGFSNKGINSTKREYTIIQINREMEFLSQQIISNKGKAFNLYKKIEEIRGLLINLLS